jgi:hypothetical protein
MFNVKSMLTEAHAKIISQARHALKGCEKKSREQTAKREALLCLLLQAGPVIRYNK